MTNQVTEADSSPSNDTRKKKKRVVFIVVGVLLVAALATGAAVLGQHLFSAPPPPPNNAANNGGNAAPGNETPADFTEFKDEKLGVSFSYPSSWAKLKTDDPQILLLTSNGPEESFLIRTSDLAKPVGQPELPEAKQLTDQIIGANKELELITEPKQIELGGLPGYFYFYRFKDQASGQFGAHSHYFLFKGNTMITMVFQTVPADKFANSAPTYDKIANSFRSTK